ncbi:MAG: phosphoadenylyl-sulfate reductase [Candidatus Margulisiibacteriota bacterium]|jgi:phosphoadenosine phosphosulfate reductase
MSDTVNLEYQNELAGKTSPEILSWTLARFGVDNIVLATSLGAEDQVLADMLVQLAPQVTIFTLDTGRLPEETYEVLAETNKKYDRHIAVAFPDAHDIEAMVNAKGPNLFYESIENRKLCCRLRKIVPLKRMLAGKAAWLTGLRRAQSVTRDRLELIEWDQNNGLFKINPLADWSEEQVWKYIKTNNVPYNKLHDKGYPSIGCAPCTRAIAPGEDLRAGRWWWELPEHKECGLHFNKEAEPK